MLRDSERDEAYVRGMAMLHREIERLLLARDYDKALDLHAQVGDALRAVRERDLLAGSEQ